MPQYQQLKKDLHENDHQTEIKTRQETAKNEANRLSKIDINYGYARVLLFFIGAAFFGCAIKWEAIGLWIAFTLISLFFVALLIAHDKVAEALEIAKSRQSFYERSSNRLNDAWRGKGKSGLRFVTSEHPYARDIDIVGEGSLFELLCESQTRSGQDILANWLLLPSSKEAAQERQKAVRELAPKIDLREALAILGDETAGMINPEALGAWGQLSGTRAASAAIFFAVLIAAFNMAAIVYAFTSHSTIPLALSVLLTFIHFFKYKAWTEKILKPLDRASAPIKQLRRILQVIEAEKFEAPRLCELQQKLLSEDSLASSRIKKLEKLIEWLSASSNAFFVPIAFLLLWLFQFAAAIESWRLQNGPHIKDWLDAAGEFEASCSLAAFAYENPDAVYPDFTEDAPEFTAKQLAHPLLPRKKRVATDISIGAGKPLLIVSGSNMSGKSTLMRSVGVNSALAFAGAPVIAQALTLSELQIGASIRTVDSLQDGVSRFYAEIQRIRQVVDMSGKTPPLLFLLDEILHGTNSHDRRIGAEAILRNLVRQGAFGIVTTHDLALSRLEEDPALGAVNVHFEDSIIEGKMVFDYLLRPGVVEKSNAIELMRAVGLEV
jgi:hypothetical protein